METIVTTSWMPHLEPIAVGETQLCLEGRRISSYAIDSDGLPFVSDGRVRQSLRFKNAFDELLASLGCDDVATVEPEPIPALVPIETVTPRVAYTTLEDEQKAMRARQDGTTRRVCRCGKTFHAARKDVRFCSRKCRDRAARQTQRLQAA